MRVIPGSRCSMRLCCACGRGGSAYTPSFDDHQDIFLSLTLVIPCPLVHICNMSPTSKRLQVSSSKRRACVKCVQGKRACDEIRPACGRCAHLHKRCTYEDQSSSVINTTFVLPDAAVARQPTLDDRSGDSWRTAPRQVFSSPPPDPHFPLRNSTKRVRSRGGSTICLAQTVTTSCLVQNTQLQPWASLCNVRYTRDGQRYDLHRAFMGNLPVAQKRR